MAVDPAVVRGEQWLAAVFPPPAAVVGGITPASLFLASSAVTAEDIGVFIEDENSVAPVLIAVERLSKAIPHEAHFEETAGRLRMRAQNTATTVLSCLRIASRAGLEGTELYANCIAEITATVVDEVGLLLTFRGNLHCRAFEENLEAIEKEAVRQLQLLQLLCRTAVVDTTAEAAEHVSAGATMGSTAGQASRALLVMQEELAKLEAEARRLALINEYPHLIVPTSSREFVQNELLKSGSRRKVFVRDCTDRGTEPTVAGGPVGDHYTVDYLWEGSLQSIRITRLADDTWVTDTELAAGHAADGGATYVPFRGDRTTYTDLPGLLWRIREVSILLHEALDRVPGRPTV